MTSSNTDFIATVIANGQRFTNWESVTIRRDYGDAVSVFQFTAAEPGPYGQGWNSIRLKPGDAVKILLGGDQVINGNVTTRAAAYDSKSHELIVAGKSLTEDIHSSVVVKPGNFNGSNFSQAAQAVLAPHPFSLVIKNPPSIISKPFKSLSVQYGESVFEFIERIAKMRGLFLTDDENGNLVASQLDPSAATVAELQEGRNILRATGKLDNQGAWSRLGHAGQHPGSDDDWTTARDNSATVTNPNARPNRTQLAISEHMGDSEDMQQRANFEAANALWTQVDVSITVVGWHKDDGSLWVPTENVTVISPMLFPNTTGSMKLGIQAVTYAQDSSNGTTTTLELKLPQALTSLAQPGTGSDPLDNPNPNPAQVDPPDTN